MYAFCGHSVDSQCEWSYAGLCAEL
jgi:hypothetical protein